VGVIFGAFEAGMPVLGLLLGHGLASVLGQATRWVGAALLIATGVYGLVQNRRSGRRDTDAPRDLGRLAITGLVLSIDNLAVGFALGTYHVSLPVAAVVIGAVSATLSLAGLELGARLGVRTGQRGETLGNLILIAVGAAIAARVLLRTTGSAGGVHSRSCRCPADEGSDHGADRQADGRRGDLGTERGGGAERVYHHQRRHQSDDPAEEQERPGSGYHQQVHQPGRNQRGGGRHQDQDGRVHITKRAVLARSQHREAEKPPAH
jgi:manganese efflux pump family protein